MDGQESLNAGTPPTHGVRLFGVKLTDFSNHHYAPIQLGAMRKSVSTDNLALAGCNAMRRHPECAQLHAELGSMHPRLEPIGAPQQGYASDGLMQGSSMSLRERKKGVPWSEDEHRLFLAGLQKLGKGDWRGISRNFVTSRTPTQVASHAQKYFLRQGNLNKRKRRSSLFDIINSNMVTRTDAMGDHSQNFGAMELAARPSFERGLQRVTASSSSRLTSLSAYRKPPSSATPSVCADLCLGCSHSRPGKQATSMDALRLSQLPSPKKVLAIDDATGTECNSKSICTGAASSPPSSSAPSVGRIDEMSELSSLSLSLGPPVSKEASERTVQPVTSRLSAGPTAMSELQEVLRTAGAGTAAGNPNKVASVANAIRVV